MRRKRRIPIMSIDEMFKEFEFNDKPATIIMDEELA